MSYVTAFFSGEYNIKLVYHTAKAVIRDDGSHVSLHTLHICDHYIYMYIQNDIYISKAFRRLGQPPQPSNVNHPNPLKGSTSIGIRLHKTYVPIIVNLTQI